MLIKTKHSNNKSIQRLKRRAAADSASDYSLDFQKHYNHRNNETNPHTDRDKFNSQRGYSG